MRLLRHPATSLWAALAVVGLVVLVVSYRGDSELAQRPNADHHAEVTAVAALRHEVSELVVLATTPDERLDDWARTAGAIAERAGDERDAAEGPGDELTRSWRAASIDIDAVATSEGAALDGAVRRVVARADELAFLVSPGGVEWGDESVLVGGDRPPLTTVTPTTVDVPAPAPVTDVSAPPLS